MIDPTGIAQDAFTSIITQHITTHLLSGDGKSVSQLLEEILTELQVYFKKEEKGDIFRLVTLYKNAQGTPWIPSLMDRVYQQVFSPVAVTINATGVLLPFSVTLQPATWTNFTFPDNTQYLLDPGYANNNLTVWVRFTNANIF